VVIVLLGLRFALELALFTTLGFLGARLSTTAPVAWALGAGVTAATIAVWATLLSPRRRIDLPLPVRAGFELILFATAAVGLAASGHPVGAVVLIGSEVVVVVALWMLGLPPGSDVAATRAGR
jgi:hypothetical protein